MTLSNPNYHQNVPSPNAIILEVRTSTYNFWGAGRVHNSVHSIINVVSTFQQLHFKMYALKGGKNTHFLKMSLPIWKLHNSKKVPFGLFRKDSVPLFMESLNSSIFYSLKICCLPCCRYWLQ